MLLMFFSVMALIYSAIYLISPLTCVLNGQVWLTIPNKKAQSVVAHVSSWFIIASSSTDVLYLATSLTVSMFQLSGSRVDKLCEPP